MPQRHDDLKYLNIHLNLKHNLFNNFAVTALESIICDQNGDQIIRHSELMEAALQLSEILSQEFILCAPCTRIEEKLLDALQDLVSKEILIDMQVFIWLLFLL